MRPTLLLGALLACSFCAAQNNVYIPPHYAADGTYIPAHYEAGPPGNYGPSVGKYGGSPFYAAPGIDWQRINQQMIANQRQLTPEEVQYQLWVREQNRKARIARRAERDRQRNIRWQMRHGSKPSHGLTPHEEWLRLYNKDQEKRDRQMRKDASKENTQGKVSKKWTKAYDRDLKRKRKQGGY